jgi:hypothetical protein
MEIATFLCFSKCLSSITIKIANKIAATAEIIAASSVIVTKLRCDSTNPLKQIAAHFWFSVSNRILSHLSHGSLCSGFCLLRRWSFKLLYRAQIGEMLESTYYGRGFEETLRQCQDVKKNFQGSKKTLKYLLRIEECLKMLIDETN